MSMTPKMCISMTLNSKITAPTTISSVPTPAGARQIVPDRLSAAAAMTAAR